MVKDGGSSETPELDTNCEIVWCKMNIIGCRTLYLGSFYRPPDKIDNDYLHLHLHLFIKLSNMTFL